MSEMNVSDMVVFFMSLCFLGQEWLQGPKYHSEIVLRWVGKAVYESIGCDHTEIEY